MNSKAILRILLPLIVLCGAARARAQGTAFTYQGRLTNQGGPANGFYDLRISVHNTTNVSGGLVAGPLTNSATPVSNGLFTVTVDFGPGVFNGSNLWLQIAVRTNGAGAFANLSPRQALTPAPYAITAGNVISGGIAEGTYGNAVTFNNVANNFTGLFAGDGSFLTNVNAATVGGFAARQFWHLGGNAGTSPGVNFVGTTDNEALELQANSQRALRLEPDTTGSGSPNVIGGSPANIMEAGGVIGGFIGGGGALNYNGAPYTNRVSAYFGTIGGGYGNTIQAFGNDAIIGGGYSNTVHAGAGGSFIGGGEHNEIQTNGSWSGISGGFQNILEINAQGSYLGGGYFNTIQSNATLAVIGGGYFNKIQTNSTGAVIAGGEDNAIGTSSTVSVIGGGNANTILANVSGSTIAGGEENVVQSGAFESTIGGGVQNTIQTNSSESVIAGGRQNTIQTNVINSSIGGGYLNIIQGSAGWCVIGGGSENTIGLFAGDSAIAGGFGNAIAQSAGGATIGGGFGNAIQYNANLAAIGGGESNTVGVQAFYSVIPGGQSNLVAGAYATVPGGYSNSALGQFSFAGGRLARAAHDGAFVWNTYANPASSFFDHRFHVYGTNGFSVDYSNQRPDGGGTKWVEIGQQFTGQTISTWTGAYLTDTGIWQSVSDRNRKTDFAPVSAREMLDKVDALTVQSWRYTNEMAGVKHIGPTAQDFHAAFGVGTDEKTIGTVDEGGVALAAIQGLNEKLEAAVKEKDARITALEKRLNDLEVIIGKFAGKELAGGSPK